MEMKDSMKTKVDTDELPYLEINIIEEMENLQREIQESGGQSFKKTTYWNQQKSGTPNSNPEQLLKISEQLEKIEEQLIKIENHLTKMTASIE